MCHVFGGMKHKAKVSVLIMSLYSGAIEDKLLAVRLAGFMCLLVMTATCCQSSAGQVDHYSLLAARQRADL